MDPKTAAQLEQLRQAWRRGVRVRRRGARPVVGAGSGRRVLAAPAGSAAFSAGSIVSGGGGGGGSGGGGGGGFYAGSGGAGSAGGGGSASAGSGWSWGGSGGGGGGGVPMAGMGYFGPNFRGPVAPSIPVQFLRDPRIRFARSVDFANLGRLTREQIGFLKMVLAEYDRGYGRLGQSAVGFRAGPALRGLAAWAPMRYGDVGPLTAVAASPGGTSAASNTAAAISRMTSTGQITGGGGGVSEE